VNISNVVETSQEVKNLSSVNPPQTLQPGDISNIATVLVKIVSVPQKANEVGYDTEMRIICCVYTTSLSLVSA
jgi:hypothetical protein